MDGQTFLSIWTIWESHPTWGLVGIREEGGCYCVYTKLVRDVYSGKRGKDYERKDGAIRAFSWKWRCLMSHDFESQAEVKVVVWVILGIIALMVEKSCL